ncbi:MAG TPA: hypothetical protein VJA82_13420 [Sediminibacterium sp.]|uniref:hypothetical protein n=1 Tax=Sediminibacterium sp. TaxID=1917865 RepID=UPI0008ADD139|nr:hypothetical protein [Sediminibacterium sp.]OHC86286.1 MAG: hypothetical protein A2472_01555 [Sphingobacteriia bacterium RIFOXYC2_FULL_35_18]OHC89798.1 MAG: hypothetical protein A2546_10800 [Sphingobacteriia bacterium RIFOXYD2_FULL_35_12]HLD54302.1 hypothetical protein [Sediminibacterium sp.]
MKKTTLYLLLIIGIICTSNFPQYKYSNQCLRVIRTIPIGVFYDDSSKLIIRKDTINLFSLGELRIIQLQPMVQFETNLNVKNSSPFFVFKQNENTGKYFLKETDSSFLMLKVDSLLFSNGLNTDKYILPDTLNWSLISAEKDKNFYETVDKYIYKGSMDPTVPDTISYYFKNASFESVFGLSKSLNQMKKSSLYKITLHYKQSNRVPLREFEYEFEQSLIEDKNFFKGYRFLDLH